MNRWENEATQKKRHDLEAVSREEAAQAAPGPTSTAPAVPESAPASVAPQPGVVAGLVHSIEAQLQDLANKVGA